MKLPAISGRIGDWIYYTTVMSFQDIADKVDPSIGEIYQASCLDELLQRELTENYKSIKQYLLTDHERFFNAIILAIFNGDPQWLEVEFPDEEQDFTNVGFLEFDGNETIFPVDGQHRVKGIIEALNEDDSIANEKVPVVFVSHRQTPEGRRRTRKLFSTLNRRNKPVGMNENIALDEDDICAIITRELIQSFPLFMGNNIVNTKGKQIPVGNKSALTSLIALYQCVDVIIQHKLSKEGIKASKYKEFKLNRPSDDKTKELSEYVFDIMNDFSNSSEPITNYQSDISEFKAEQYRSKSGGHILFRPIVITEYFSAAAILVEKMDISYSDAFGRLNVINTLLSERPWKGLVWDGVKIINRTSKTIIRNIFLYKVDPMTLDNKSKEKLIDDYAKSLNVGIEEARIILDA